eukprot:TRINITY_DN39435_c0_g1_i1.p1 TRINITY_DN39435_c0_g1~~TRINITY_DN39435_c0_g1_i1.p1  ORF type:complete len:249 (+),score=40.86 TRINITY_DN39435_c0_g1_i1:199-945(+)
MLYERARIHTKPQVPNWVTSFLPNQGVVILTEQRRFELDSEGRVRSLHLLFENESLAQRAAYKELLSYTPDPERPDWTVKRIQCQVYVQFNPLGMRKHFQNYMLTRAKEELEVGRKMDLQVSMEFSEIPKEIRGQSFCFSPVRRVTSFGLDYSDEDEDDFDSPGYETADEIDQELLCDLTDMLGLKFPSRDSIKRELTNAVLDSESGSVYSASPGRVRRHNTTVAEATPAIAVREDEESCKCKFCVVQ